MASNTHTTRRAFGCVLEKKDKNGRTIGWMAQYADPKKKRHKVALPFLVCKDVFDSSGVDKASLAVVFEVVESHGDAA
ncbi:hypothetical protein, partial [Bifidobacterium pseudolongum]|uniref:hypothetical protein n=2 Tax=Bifidobacterium TaxID=1678 RepID=UPI001021F67C